MTVTIRRTQWGWSAFQGGLIASSDHPGELLDYILTLEPEQVVIDNTDPVLAALRASGLPYTYDPDGPVPDPGRCIHDFPLGLHCHDGNE